MNGFRTVALFEFIKGSLALVASTMLFSVDENSVKNIAFKILSYIHPGTADLAEVRLLFWPALVYSILRYIEAYGLWSERQWGRRFAIFSTAIYLPFEVFEMYKAMSPVKTLITLINLLILAYLIFKKQNPSKSRLTEDFEGQFKI